MELSDGLELERLVRNFGPWDQSTHGMIFGGLRIEENCFITEEGARRLGPHKPPTAEEIEGLRGG